MNKFIRLFYFLPYIILHFEGLVLGLATLLLGHFPVDSMQDPYAVFGEPLDTLICLFRYSLFCALFFTPMVVLLAFIYKRAPSMSYHIVFLAGLLLLYLAVKLGFFNWGLD